VSRTSRSNSQQRRKYLLDITQLLNDQVQRLLVVSHATQDEDHLWHKTAALAHLIGLLQRVVVALPQEGQQHLVIILGIEVNLQLVEIRATVGIVLEQSVEVGVQESWIIAQLIHHSGNRNPFCVLDQHLDGGARCGLIRRDLLLVTVEFHEQHNLVLNCVEQVVLFNELKDITPPQFEEDGQRFVVFLVICVT